MRDAWGWLWGPNQLAINKLPTGLEMALRVALGSALPGYAPVVSRTYPGAGPVWIA